MMPPGEEMGFELIRQVQLKESRSQAPTRVPADFFEQLAVHIDRLKTLAREEMARDPMSARATLVQNELRSTIQAAREIVMLRLRKLANRAVDALEGGKVDLHYLTPAELALYGELASFFARGHDGLLPSDRSPRSVAAAAVASLAGSADGDLEAQPPAVAGAAQAPPRATPTGLTASTQTTMKNAPTTASTHGPTSAHASAQTSTQTSAHAHATPHPTTVTAPSPPTTTRTVPEDLVVHVLRDVPQFASEGGASYTLRAGDVVNLPRRLAEVLVQRGVAEAIDVAPPVRA